MMNLIAELQRTDDLYSFRTMARPQNQCQRHDQRKHMRANLHNANEPGSATAVTRRVRFANLHFLIRTSRSSLPVFLIILRSLRSFAAIPFPSGFRSRRSTQDARRTIGASLGFGVWCLGFSPRPSPTPETPS